MNKKIVAIVSISILVILSSTASAVYNPELGRFLQRDPEGYVDGMSLYEYVSSGPVRWVDPMGRERRPLVTKDVTISPPRNSFRYNKPSRVKITFKCCDDKTEIPRLIKAYQASFRGIVASASDIDDILKTSTKKELEQRSKRPLHTIAKFDPNNVRIEGDAVDRLIFWFAKPEKNSISTKEMSDISKQLWSTAKGYTNNQIFVCKNRAFTWDFLTPGKTGSRVDFFPKRINFYKGYFDRALAVKQPAWLAHEMMHLWADTVIFGEEYFDGFKKKRLKRDDVDTYMSPMFGSWFRAKSMKTRIRTADRYEEFLYYNYLPR